MNGVGVEILVGKNESLLVSLENLMVKEFPRIFSAIAQIISKVSFCFPEWQASVAFEFGEKI